jgi:hypothetical protein
VTVSTMRRVLQEKHGPHSFYEKAIRKSCPHVVHRVRQAPRARMAHSGYGEVIPNAVIFPLSPKRTERYAEFAEAMENHNNREVAELFRKLTEEWLKRTPAPPSNWAFDPDPPVLSGAAGTGPDLETAAGQPLPRNEHDLRRRSARCAGQDRTGSDGGGSGLVRVSMAAAHSGDHGPGRFAEGHW